MLRILALVATLLMLAGCAASPQIDQSQDDTARAALKDPGGGDGGSGM